ncbi:ABC transporter permease [bacterium]|nr:ABC transporter permease [bacterium]
MAFLIEAWEAVKLAMGALRANKMRSFLTLLGIIIGVTTVISIISLTQGLDKAFGEQISSLGSDVLYVQKFSWFNKQDWDEFRNRKDITMDEVKAIRKYATLISAVSPSVGTRKTVRYKNKSVERVSVSGTDEEKTSNVFPQYGRDLTSFDVDNRRNVCVLGWQVADDLFKDTDPIGKWVKIGGYRFRVIGVYEKQGSLFGFDLDQEVRIPIGVFFKLFGRHRNITITVKVKDTKYIEDAKDEIRGILRRVRKVPPGKDDDFSINQMDMIMDMYKRLTAALYAAAIGVGAISLLVGGIGIMNIMLVSVTERTKEIGIRKAIGARRRNIMVQFLVESVVISGVGGIIGVLLGFGLGKIIASVSPLPATVSLWSVFLGIGFSSLVGIFFGLYPAGKAAKLNPVDALHYE